MAKIYLDNYKLIGAKNRIFSKLEKEPSENIFEVLKLLSGDFLPKSKIIDGPCKVYGGGGFTGNYHIKNNITYQAIGIGRVGARCGCVFKIDPNSWITDNALYSNKIKDGYYIDFLIHWLNYKSINQYANTAAQPVISLKRISNISIPKIDIKSQIEIAKLLNKIENGEAIEPDIWGVSEMLRIISYLEDYNFESEAQSSYISKIRQSILQEAIEGKLTADWRKKNPVKKGDPNTDASALLEKIKAEKQKLIAEGKLKKEKPLAPIKPEEIPFDLPKGWVWCRLGEICNYGSSPKADPKDVKNNTWVLDLEDIEKETSKLLCKIRFKERKSLSTKSIFSKGNVLYSKLRPYLDKVVVADENGVCTTEILPLHFWGGIDSFYARYTLKRRDFLKYVNSVTKGMKMPRLGTKEGELALIPIPPIAEQRSIVVFIDRFHAIIDDLEKQVTERKSHAEELMQAVLREAFEGEGVE